MRIKIDPRILTAAEKLAGLPDPKNTPQPLKITKPGIYTDFDERSYHDDPCPEPSASRSIIKAIAERTPRHAFIAHPRLNPDFRRKERSDFDLGTAAHTALLTRGRKIVEVQAKDWRTDAAKMLRDTARAQGYTPILTEQLDRVRKMIAAVAEQLPDHGMADLFDPERGSAEVCVAHLDPIGGWCRAMLDWLEKDTLAVTDFKTTEIDDFTPEGLGRHCAAQGYEVQHAFYERMLVGRFPELEGRFRFRLLFAEAKEPFAILPVTLPADAIEKGRALVDRGLRRWAAAKASGLWPRYKTDGNLIVDYPPWATADFI